jgi:hypothetical protein
MQYVIERAAGGGASGTTSISNETAFIKLARYKKKKLLKGRRGERPETG